MPLLAALPLLLSASPATMTTQRSPSTNRAEPQFRVEAAAAALAALEQIGREKDVEVAWEIEQTVRWSKRLLHAQLDIAVTPAQREKAADAYLRRMVHLSDRSIWSHRPRRHTQLDAAAVNYFIIEAQEILACVRTNKPLPSSCD